MAVDASVPSISLPRGGPGAVRTTVLHVVSLVRYAAISTHSWAAESTNARVRLKAENDRLLSEIALLREEGGSV